MSDEPPAHLPGEQTGAGRATDLVEQAESSLDAGDLTDAESRLRQAIDLDPANADAWLLLGAVCGETNRIDEAAGYLRRAIAIDPASPAAHLTLGQLQGATGNYTQAIESFRTALVHAPDDVDAHLALAQVMIATGDPALVADAPRHVDIVTGGQPDSLPAWQLAAWLAASSDRPEAEIASLGNILRLAPDAAQSAVRLGALLARTGRIDEAVVAMEDAMRCNPTPELAAQLARTLGECGRFVEALEYAEEACRLDPDKLENELRIIGLRADHGDFDYAFERLRPWLESERPPFNAVTIFARISIVLNLIDDARYLLRRLLDRDLTPEQRETATSALDWLDANELPEP